MHCSPQTRAKTIKTRRRRKASPRWSCSTCRPSIAPWPPSTSRSQTSSTTSSNSRRSSLRAVAKDAPVRPLRQKRPVKRWEFGAGLQVMCHCGIMSYHELIMYLVIDHNDSWMLKWMYKPYCTCLYAEHRTETNPLSATFIITDDISAVVDICDDVMTTAPILDGQVLWVHFWCTRCECVCAWMVLS